jgi:hypothetical protein
MINYGLLNKSIEYYEKLGYRRIESPWVVDENISAITKPDECKDYKILNPSFPNKVLVASGEQSFLSLYKNNNLPLGKFQTITPCFRDDEEDDWHSKWFIKNELIRTDTTKLSDLQELVDQALEFFNSLKGMGTLKKQVIKSSDNHDYQIDILLDGIELGSYGIRRCSFLTWIYGTALAEPRFSQVWDYVHKY